MCVNKCNSCLAFVITFFFGKKNQDIFFVFIMLYALNAPLCLCYPFTPSVNIPTWIDLKPGFKQ